MRESWERHTDVLTFDMDSLTDLIQPAFGGYRVVAAQVTEGGLINTNYRLQLINN
ncbi:MAG TPA: hypothetical protein V6D14_11715 [Coleofasciculaceae cyanobacterium]